MDDLQKIQFAANSYYNRGLEMAKERDLSGAALYLKRALQFNKYHTDARNLLGLIFYEMGETSDALTQWVISINLQPENNRADHYLDEVQRKPGQLEIASQTIKKYNQALFHAQGGSDDLAVCLLYTSHRRNTHIPHHRRKTRSFRSRPGAYSLEYASISYAPYTVPLYSR